MFYTIPKITKQNKTKKKGNKTQSHDKSQFAVQVVSGTFGRQVGGWMAKQIGTTKF